MESSLLKERQIENTFQINKGGFNEILDFQVLLEGIILNLSFSLYDKSYLSQGVFFQNHIFYYFTFYMNNYQKLLNYRYTENFKTYTMEN